MPPSPSPASTRTWWLGFSLWFAIWLAGTVAIFSVEERGWAFAITIGVAFVFAAIKNVGRKREMGTLVDEYVGRYGAPPPGFSTRNTGIGYAAGAFAGNANAGGLIGAAVDLFRMHREQHGMSADQKALHDRIRGLQAWSPFHSVFMLAVWLGLSFAAGWVVGIAKPQVKREPPPHPEVAIQAAAPRHSAGRVLHV